MKNYYDTKREVEIVRLRLKSLREKKESLRVFVEPKASRTDKIFIDSGGFSDASFVTYVYLISEVDKSIKEAEGLLFSLETNLKRMGAIIRGIKDVHYRIFVMRYIDGLSSQKIAHTLNYSRRRVDQILQIIKLKLRG